MAAPPAKIDRQTTTPFLLHLCYKQGSFHRLDEFSPNARPPQHLQVYTWQSCSLSELANLLLQALPHLLQRPYAGTRVAFRLVYADLNGSRPGAPRYISRELGSIVIGEGTQDEDEEMNGGESTAGGVKKALERLDGEPEKTLQEGKFVIGDYVCCAILAPLADGSVAAVPPPPGMGRGPMRGGRENGFGGRGGGGSGDYGYGGRGGGRGRQPYEDRRPSGGLPAGEWRRGEAPPDSFGERPRGEGGSWRGGEGRGGGRGRGRGGRW